MKKLNTLDKYVIFSIVMVITYTIAEFISDTPHDILTGCFFSCFGGEMLYCCLLKRLKIKKNTEGVQNDFQ